MMRQAQQFIGLTSLILTACGTNPPEFINGLPPLEDHLNCLPRDTAMISAHRATAYDWGLPENSLSGLTKLAKGRYLMAEIDVAKTIDGTHFLFHDGVWDEVSTGKGPIAKANSQALETILLKSRNGRLSSERPPTLDTALALAKDRQLYLEIDFKSSAKYDVVISKIREARMAKNVILISYTKGQRERLKKLAPEMLVSSNSSYAKDGDLIWAGKDVTRPLDKNRKTKMVIGRVSRPDNTKGLSLAISQSHILVTDDANQYLPITGLTKKNKKDYEDCLAKIR